MHGIRSKTTYKKENRRPQSCTLTSTIGSIECVKDLVIQTSISKQNFHPNLMESNYAHFMGQKPTYRDMDKGI